VVAEPEPTVYSAVNALLSGMELDPAGNARAAIARALARKLDEAGHQDSGTIAMAMSGIAKELRGTLDTILEGTGDSQTFLADLFATA
jgi:hypothetical protein